MNARRDLFRFVGLLLFSAVLIQAQNAQAPTPPSSGRQPPQAPPPVIPAIKFAVIGDTGTGTKPQYEVADRLFKSRTTFPFELIIMRGDNLYGGESERDFQNKFEKPYKSL